jgi:hypothetical protein
MARQGAFFSVDFIVPVLPVLVDLVAGLLSQARLKKAKKPANTHRAISFFIAKPSFRR